MQDGNPQPARLFGGDPPSGSTRVNTALGGREQEQTNLFLSNGRAPVSGLRKNRIKCHPRNVSSHNVVATFKSRWESFRTAEVQSGIWSCEYLKGTPNQSCYGAAS